MNRFIVNAKLPSLNEYIDVCRSNKYQAAGYKRDIEEMIGWAIKQALVKRELKATNKPCIVKFTWIEKDARRDYDNIAFAKKFILDAMQKQGIIPNDNRKYVKGFTDSFGIGDNYKVIVELLEC